MAISADLLELVEDVHEKLGTKEALVAEMVGKSEIDSVLLDALADVIERDVLLVVSMTRSILNTFASCGVDPDMGIQVGGDVLINRETVTAAEEDSAPIRELVNQLRLFAEGARQEEAEASV